AGIPGRRLRGAGAPGRSDERRTRLQLRERAGRADHLSALVRHCPGGRGAARRAPVPHRLAPAPRHLVDERARRRRCRGGGGRHLVRPARACRGGRARRARRRRRPGVLAGRSPRPRSAAGNSLSPPEKRAIMISIVVYTLVACVHGHCTPDPYGSGMRSLADCERYRAYFLAAPRRAEHPTYKCVKTTEPIEWMLSSQRAAPKPQATP